MVAFLEDIIEIFRAAVADLSPNFYMGEGIKASPKKRLVGLQIFKGHNLIALKLFSVSVKFKSSFNFFPPANCTKVFIKAIWNIFLGGFF